MCWCFFLVFVTPVDASYPKDRGYAASSWVALAFPAAFLLLVLMCGTYMVRSCRWQAARRTKASAACAHLLLVWPWLWRCWLWPCASGCITRYRRQRIIRGKLHGAPLLLRVDYAVVASRSPMHSFVSAGCQCNGLTAVVIVVGCAVHRLFCGVASSSRCLCSPPLPSMVLHCLPSSFACVHTHADEWLPHCCVWRRPRITGVITETDRDVLGVFICLFVMFGWLIGGAPVNWVRCHASHTTLPH